MNKIQNKTKILSMREKEAARKEGITGLLSIKFRCD